MILFRGIILRPIARQGKEYYQELRTVLKEIGYDLLDNACSQPKTPANIGLLALKYQLNFKATCEFLEDKKIIPYGTYDRITRSHRPTTILQYAWDHMGEEEHATLLATQQHEQAA